MSDNGGTSPSVPARGRSPREPWSQRSRSWEHQRQQLGMTWEIRPQNAQQVLFSLILNILRGCNDMKQIKHAKTCQNLPHPWHNAYHATTLINIVDSSYCSCVWAAWHDNDPERLGGTAQELHMLHLSVQEIVVLDGLVRCCQMLSETFCNSATKLFPDLVQSSTEDNRREPKHARRNKSSQ